MIIKKFVGKTEAEAADAARKELGEGVVIMNVKDVKRKGFFALFRPRQVEVTVALESENESQQKAPANRGFSTSMEQAGAGAMSTRGGSLLGGGPQQDAGADGTGLNLLNAMGINTNGLLSNGGSSQGVDSSGTSSNGTGSTGINSTGINSLGAGANGKPSQDIERKLDSLLMFLENQFTREEARGNAEEEEESQDKGLEEAGNTEQDKFIRLLYNTMLENEVDEKYANLIIEETDKNRKPNIPFDYILANIYQKIVLKFGKSEGILPAQDGPRVVFFIGPTGVGKTTTIAKIASSLSVDDKKKIAFITTDTYRIAAAEQLHTYASILEAPFRVVYTEEELTEAVRDYHEFDFIFVDTAGHSHKNEEQMDKMKSFLGTVGDDADYQTFLVLSATTKYRDLRKIADSYRDTADYQLIFTKLDETTTLGSLFNMRMYTDAPIAYVTSGQNVPDDIERFNPQKTVKQLLGGKH